MPSLLVGSTLRTALVATWLAAVLGAAWWRSHTEVVRADANAAGVPALARLSEAR